MTNIESGAFTDGTDRLRSPKYVHFVFPPSAWGMGPMSGETTGQSNGHVATPFPYARHSTTDEPSAFASENEFVSADVQMKLLSMAIG
ncbi:uncharacterized protein LTR77_004872 [Saxophila tyrrhenica]|uniref:Uncharacterized protein n=1 Tax=Saxophila tyrrhenica TaxID=1690608 RepID=A0AAV9PDH7_9PEZI|nr:hypothetical protein LTR77_004872 [Saxophila tyrrhenica]